VDMPPNPSLKGLHFEELSVLTSQLGLSDGLRGRTGS